MITRNHVPHTVEDDGGLLYDVERSQSGSLTGKIRVYGQVSIDGIVYTYDQHIRVKLKKVKP